uniref:SURF1-like protein n=1 Tax=Panagrolaimus davidi TaxID=227884 RepID=A0A914QLX7_9BILA
MTESKDDENHPIKRFGILPWILTFLVFASTGLNLWQKHQITLFEKELQKCQSQLITITSDPKRTKRDIPINTLPSSYYLPLYTQLTPQAVKQLCANRYDTIDNNDNSITSNNNNNYEQQPNDVIIIPATSASSNAGSNESHERRSGNGGKHVSDKNRTNKWKGSGLSKNGKRKSYYKVQKHVKTAVLFDYLLFANLFEYEI